MIDWKSIRHFKPVEFARPDLLRPKMIEMLDELRHRVGSPLVVTSSYRSPDHNASVGGAPESSHCPAPDGLYSGIDFTTATGSISPRALYRIQEIAYDVGFRRIGLYVDMRHLHLDCETRLDQEVVWIK